MTGHIDDLVRISNTQHIEIQTQRLYFLVLIGCIYKCELYCTEHHQINEILNVINGCALIRQVD